MKKKLPLLLLFFAMVVSGQAQGFDLATGRVPLASLDGLWRFHTGDNAAWAASDFDDAQWPLLKSTEVWSTQGYKDYGGLAWYRFQVTVPAGLDRVSILLPAISTCYEVYADGKLIGTYGKMPPSPSPAAGAGSQAWQLPYGNASARKVEIALRVWHWPVWAMYFSGGPVVGGGLVGASTQINDRLSATRTTASWNNATEGILALLTTLGGIGALALFLMRRKETEYLWFGLLMMLSALAYGYDLSWITRTGSPIYRDFVLGVAYGLANIAYLAFLVRLLQAHRTWAVRLAVVSIVSTFLATAYAFFTEYLGGVGLDNIIQGTYTLTFDLCVIAIVFRGVLNRSTDAMLLAVPTIASAIVDLVQNAAWTTYTLTWQHTFRGIVTLTRKPFPITLSDATTLSFILAVFGILVLRFTRTRAEEERYATEFASARSVQQFLIPEQLPPTPGLRIESEYRPSLEVGGDFFQVLPHPTDGSTLIVVGDVAGKGLEAGMTATLIVGAIRTAAEFTTDPGRVLALLNKRLQGRALVTCMALRMEQDGRVALANAGHLPPYLNGQELAVEGALPLGAVPGIEFPVLHFTLAATDTLMLMTDGVAEAQDSEGHLFGFDRIAEMLRNGTAAAALASAAQSFGQEDDITVLTLSYAGLPIPA